MKTSLWKISFALAVISLYTFLFGIVGTISNNAGIDIPAVSDTRSYDISTTTEPPKTTINITNRRMANFADYNAPASVTTSMTTPFTQTTTGGLPSAPTTTSTTRATTTTSRSTTITATTTSSPATTITTTTSRSTTTGAAGTPPEATPVTTARVNPANERFRVTVRGQLMEGDAFDITARTVQGEIGSRFHDEAVKAQAIAIYTYIKYQNSINVAPSLPVAATATQRIADLTREVFGELIYHDNRIINAVFSASSAGYTSSARNVWGSEVAYLQSVRTQFDEQHDPNMGMTIIYTSAEIRDAVQQQTGITLTGNPANWLRINNHIDTVYVGEMSIGGRTTFTNAGREITFTGRVFRERVMQFGNAERRFRSASFSFAYDATTDTFTFTTNGYGHGVGMSQNGANILATHRGFTYKEILRFYYTGVEIR